LDRLARSPQQNEIARIEFDLAVTISVLRYISDLRNGRVNPQSLKITLDGDRAHFDLPDFMFHELMRSGDVDATLSTVEPPFPVYARTEKALKSYLELASKGDGDPVFAPTKPVKKGAAISDLPALAARLKLLGDLPEEYVVAGNRYTTPVVDAVKHFQGRHGLEANGLLDAETVHELNIPLSRRVTQLQLTMERLRWLPRQFSKPPVVVNIPEFRLHADDEEYH
jgi:L,D-transpeptidase YcbB